MESINNQGKFNIIKNETDKIFFKDISNIIAFSLKDLIDHPEFLYSKRGMIVIDEKERDSNNGIKGMINSFKSSLHVYQSEGHVKVQDYYKKYEFELTSNYKGVKAVSSIKLDQKKIRVELFSNENKIDQDAHLYQYEIVINENDEEEIQGIKRETILLADGIEYMTSLYKKPNKIYDRLSIGKEENTTATMR